MKINFRILIIAAFLAIAPSLMFAQAPPLPGDGDGTSTPTGPKVGDPPAGAPIGNGTLILLTLAAAYAGRKVYVMRTEKEEVTG